MLLCGCFCLDFIAGQVVFKFVVAEELCCWCETNPILGKKQQKKKKHVTFFTGQGDFHCPNVFNI